MRCDRCHKKVDRAYLEKGELLCWFCAGENTRATKKMVNKEPKKVPGPKERQPAKVKIAKKPSEVATFVYGLLAKDRKMATENIIEKVLEKFPGIAVTNACIFGYKAHYTRQNGPIQTNKEITLYEAVRQLGGAAPHKKGMPGALTAEYNAVVPLHCRRSKSKGGRPLDELAAALSKQYPQFGIEDEKGLLDALKLEDVARLRGIE